MPYVFADPVEKYQRKLGSAYLQIKFPQVETINSYSVVASNIISWNIASSGDGVQWGEIDYRTNQTTLAPKYFMSQPNSNLYFKFTAIQLLFDKTYASISNLYFTNSFNQYVVPDLTTGTSTKNSVYIGSVQRYPITTTTIIDKITVSGTDYSGEIKTFTFVAPVNYEFLRSDKPATVLGSVNGTSYEVAGTQSRYNKISVVYPVANKPNMIDLYDSNCNPLSNTAYIGGSQRIGNEYIQCTFIQSVSANSYMFSVPQGIYPTWFSVDGKTGTGDWVRLHSHKHVYESYTEYSNVFTNPIPYSSYRMNVYSMHGSTNAQLLSFNVYDENGTEFIRTLTNTDTGRTNAPVITNSDNVIEFRIPVIVRKVVFTSRTGTLSIKGDGVPLTYTDETNFLNITSLRLCKKFEITGLLNVALHGSKGRINPFPDGSSCYGGRVIQTSNPSLSISLPASVPTFGSKYQIRTTPDANIVAFRILNQASVEIANRSNLYNNGSYIEGSITEGAHTRYQLVIDEIEANKTTANVGVVTFSVLSPTYIPILPNLSAYDTVSTFSVPTSLEGAYRIECPSTQLLPSGAPVKFSNLFDGNIQNTFRTEPTVKSLQLIFTVPYPTSINAFSITGGLGELTPNIWTLSGYADLTSNWTELTKFNGYTRIPSNNTTQTMITTPTVRSVQYRKFKLDIAGTAADVSPLEIADIRFINGSGEFVPMLEFTSATIESGVTVSTTVSTKTQHIYGGTAASPPYIKITFPSAVTPKTFELVGSSLPSNVYVTTHDGTVVGSSDSFFGRCVVSVPSPAQRNIWYLYTNRVRSNQGGVQCINISDVIIRDSNGFILTSVVSGATKGGLQSGWTTTTPTRYGGSRVTSNVSVTKGTGFSYYGYRVKFTTGVRSWVVTNELGGILDSRTLTAPVTETMQFSNVYGTPKLVNLVVTSTFEGTSNVGISNFNIVDVFGRSNLNCITGSLASIVTSRGDYPGFLTYLAGKLGESVSYSYPQNVLVKNAVIHSQIPLQYSIIVPDDVNYKEYTGFSASNLVSGTYSVRADSWIENPVELFTGEAPCIFSRDRNVVSNVTIDFPSPMQISTISFSIPTNPDTGLPFAQLPSINIYTETDVTEVQYNSKPRNTEYTIKINRNTKWCRIQCYTKDVKTIACITNFKFNQFAMLNSNVTCNRYGNMLQFYPGRKDYTVPMNFNGKDVVIKCTRVFPEDDMYNGSVKLFNTTVLMDNSVDRFGSMTQNVYDDFVYTSFDEVTGFSYIWMNLGIVKTVIKEEFVSNDPLYGQAYNSQLQVLVGTNWVNATLPVIASVFRRVIYSIKNFKDGSVKVKSWKLYTTDNLVFPSLQTSNESKVVTKYQESSFYKINGKLTIS